VLSCLYAKPMAEQPEKVPFHPIAPRLQNGPKKPHIGPHIHAYREVHKESLGQESDKWWAKVCNDHCGRRTLSNCAQQAHDFLHWDRPFKTVRAGGFTTGDVVWFPEGGLNAAYNCVDRWAFKHPDKVCQSLGVTTNESSSIDFRLLSYTRPMNRTEVAKSLLPSFFVRSPVLPMSSSLLE
jgi:hypothetical protein